MSYAPVIPLGGSAGWAFLKRTLPAQKAAFEGTAAAKRDEAYFREKIGKIDTAAQLVADRRLLHVALGAYGLDSDIDNKFFIKKVLEEGTLRTGTLANRLADKQYQKLSADFGFGDFTTPRTKLSDFADKTLALFKTRQFEKAVGEQDSDLRFALNAERELPALAKQTSSEDTLWYTVLGNAPLRKVFERALRLPQSFGSIDLDRQLATMKAKTEQRFGSSSVRQFVDPEKLSALVRQFLAVSDSTAAASQSTPGASALQLLQTGASQSLLARL